jgi:hypothetical protein
MFHEIIQLSQFSYTKKIPVKIQIMGEKWTIMTFHDYRWKRVSMMDDFETIILGNKKLNDSCVTQV